MSLKFAGYAALFDKRDDGRDVIRKGAFARTLAEREERLPLFWQHRPDNRIGWVERISEDAKGLRVIASIDNANGGAAAALKAGKTNGLSFGYRARGYLRDEAGRELTEIDLHEVSLVSHPMQHAARVHMVRSPEQKFNQRHYPENGQFARAGEGVFYGGGSSRAGLVAGSHHATSETANSRTAFLNATSGGSSKPHREIVVIGDRDQQLRDDFDAAFPPASRPKQGPQSTQQPSGVKPRGPSTSEELGGLSAQYETGGRGVGTVSTGMGRNGVPDRGGPSYGSYQMTSQDHRKEKDGSIVIIRNGGNVARFLRTDGAPWSREFAGHVPGSRGFSDVWRQIARRDGAALHTAEHAWVKRENYDPAVSLIKNATRLDIDSATSAVRDVLWSTAVQHGAGSLRKKNGAAQIFVDAIANTDASTARNSSDYPGMLIRNVYARRSAYWPSDRPRYRSEMQNALSRLRSE